MKHIKYILFAASVAMAVVSCKKPDYSISISTDIQEESIVITKKTPVTIKYSVNYSEGVLNVNIESSANIVTKHFTDDGATGIVTASLLESGNDSFVRIIADNGTNQAEYTLKLEMESIISNGETEIKVTPDGGKVGLKIKSNVEYKLEIPEEYASWITPDDAESTKTMVPYTVYVNVAQNEDVTRTAKLVVKSTASKEIRSEFTIIQAGVLNNLRIGCGKANITAPNLLGTDPSGKIYWGDKFSVDWVKDASHTYTDGIKDHVMEIHTKATGFEFTKMTGVTKIDIIDF